MEEIQLVNRSHNSKDRLYNVQEKKGQKETTQKAQDWSLIEHELH